VPTSRNPLHYVEVTVGTVTTTMTEKDTVSHLAAGSTCDGFPAEGAILRRWAVWCTGGSAATLDAYLANAAAASSVWTPEELIVPAVKTIAVDTGGASGDTCYDSGAIEVPVRLTVVSGKMIGTLYTGLVADANTTTGTVIGLWFDMGLASEE
jgi:hypothetical protein